MRFEYRSFHLTARDDLDEVLNQWGKAGWRVIYMDRSGGFTYITMERME